MSNDFWTIVSATTFVCLCMVALLITVINMAMTQELTRVAKKINHQLDRIEGVQAAEAQDIGRLYRAHHNGGDVSQPPE